jgi:ABC-type maltose transport system permease subunit
VNADEAVKNGFTAAAIVVVLPIMLLGAVAQAREDAGICGWGKHTYAC